MYFVDTHAHIVDEWMIKEGERARVRYIVNVATDEESVKKCLAYAKRYEGIFATVGIHPSNASDIDEVDMKRFLRMRDERIVAVGEVGLDKKRKDFGKQKEALIRFLHLAQTLSLPVILHCRGAEEEMLEILRGNLPSKGGVWHCFLGGEDIAKEVTKMGLFVSFSPAILRKKERLSSILSVIPFDRILIETDAPYIGRSPRDVVNVAKGLAEALSLTLEDIARITSANAYIVFGVGEKPPSGVIAYKIRSSLYLNITNRCTNDCVFCVRKHTDFVKGHNLRLAKEPSFEEIMDAIKNPEEYEEVVFCGYGEPTLRWDIVQRVAEALRKRGAKKLRLNTNGHAFLINGEGIFNSITALFDEVRVSVNTGDEESYSRVCRPYFGGRTFSAVLHFIKTLKPFIKVSLTAVDYPEVDIEQCKRLAATLSLPLRVRRYKEVG